MSGDTFELRVRQILADVLQIDFSSIDYDTCMDNTASWDSFNHISVVFGLEEEFGISFEIDEMESMLSFFDVLQIVEAKL